MDDLISRQAAIDAITDERIVTNMDSVYDSELHRCKRATHRILASLPSAQRKGKWITKMVDCSNILLPFCSVCNKPLMFHDHNLRPNFCPNCGAEMLKGEEDETD